MCIRSATAEVKRLGDMRLSHLVGELQIGERSGDAKDAIEGSGREGSGAKTSLEQSEARPAEGGLRAQSSGIQLGIGASLGRRDPLSPELSGLSNPIGNPVSSFSRSTNDLFEGQRRNLDEKVDAVEQRA